MKREQKFLVPRWRKAPNPKSVGNTELFQAQKTETRKYGTRMFHQVSLKLGLGKTFPKSACVCVRVCARALSRCHVWLWDPMNFSPPGSPVHGTFHARILERVAISSSMGSSWPRDCTCLSFTASGFFIAGTPGKHLCYLTTVTNFPFYSYLELAFNPLPS